MRADTESKIICAQLNLMTSQWFQLTNLLYKDCELHCELRINNNTEYFAWAVLT